MTNSRLTDPEVLEWRFPVRVDSFAIRRGSGGAGRWRGGDGAIRRMRFQETAPWCPSPRPTPFEVGPDDVLVVETPGGGYGPYPEE